MKTRIVLLAALVFSAFHVSLARDRPKFAWVGSWSASPMPMRMKDPVADSTFRQVVHLSLAGDALRVTLTNAFGTTPLAIANAHVAVSLAGGAIQPGSDHPLTFDHHNDVVIPAGAYIVSDPLPMPVAEASNLVVTFYLPQQPVDTPTCHQTAISTNYIAPGNQSAEAALHNAHSQTSWCFLQGVEVQPLDKHAAAIVTLGDSITDGAHSTPDANRRYPDDLAALLAADHKTAGLAVLNEGISGGRVLYEGHGPSAIQRFDRDVLAQPGVRYVIYLEGINDIGQIMKSDSPENKLTVDELTLAASQLVQRAHEHGVQVIGATLLPFGAANGSTKPGWQRAQEVLSQYNDWVRHSGVFDAVADFNHAVADPNAPQSMQSRYDSGDHVHPSDAGYDAMAHAVDLSIFSK